MRHGKTPKLEEAGVASDAERPLGELGHKQAKAAGKALTRLDLVPDLVLTSPILRARETAEAVVKGLRGEVKLQAFEPLSTAGGAEALHEALQKFGSVKRLMLVGHQPTLGELASLLLTGGPSLAMEIKPGGALCIEMDTIHGAGALLWLLTPHQIASLG